MVMLQSGAGKGCAVTLDKDSRSKLKVITKLSGSIFTHRVLDFEKECSDLNKSRSEVNII